MKFTTRSNDLRYHQDWISLVGLVGYFFLFWVWKSRVGGPPIISYHNKRMYFRLLKNPHGPLEKVFGLSMKLVGPSFLTMGKLGKRFDPAPYNAPPTTKVD